LFAPTALAEAQQSAVGVLSAADLSFYFMALSGALLAATLTLGWYARRNYRELQEALAELKETRAQVVHSEKMSTLGQMVSGIVHEINTPLAYVKNSLQLIEAQFKPLVDAIGRSNAFLQIMAAHPRDVELTRTRFQSARDAMQAIGPIEDLHDLGQAVTDSLRGVGRITEIVGDLRVFSRLDRAAYDLLDVNKAFDATLSIARNLVKRARVVKEYGEVPPVWCAPTQINQVMLNLVTNACQAAERSRCEIVLRSRTTESSVEFEVEDNGRGIAEDMLPKIWDPFFTTKKADEGTGLGLSIVKKIVEAHNGTIRVRSVAGKGSVFTVALPLAIPPSAMPA
jgi:signal transduction histidine kinase